MSETVTWHSGNTFTSAAAYTMIYISVESTGEPEGHALLVEAGMMHAEGPSSQF